MLPYRFRPPAMGIERGKKRGNKDKQSKQQSHGGGGVLQRAIENDLKQLCPLFLKQFEQKQQDHTTKTSSGSTSHQLPNHHRHYHMKPGIAFQSFKQTFGKAKVAALHSMVPPKCDAEAYSQLLYASCLHLLKQSTNVPESCHALFCLYALYQTNPLPKSVDTYRNNNNNNNNNPYQLLSIGLRNPENPKFLYRRAFHQPIRIDHYHYSLLLKLRDDALALQAECHEKWWNQWIQQQQQQQQTSPHPINNPWVCHCGMTTDMVVVLERLFPVLEWAEYTGPVSLEGLAGHDEYPFMDDGRMSSYLLSSSPSSHPQSSSVTGTGGVTTEEGEPIQLPLPPMTNMAYSKHLQDLLREYQTSLQSIRMEDNDRDKNINHRTIGSKWTRPHPPIRKTALDPLFQSTDSWKDVEYQLFPSSKSQQQQQQQQQNDTTKTTTTATVAAQNPATPSATKRRLFARPINTSRMANTTDTPMIEELSQSYTNPNQMNDTESAVITTTKEQQETPSYELILPSGLSTTMENALQASLEVLLLDRRVVPPPFPEDGEKEEPPTILQVKALDDISSMGEDGGISIATGHGQRALQALLSKAQQQNISTQPIPRQVVRSKAPSKPNPLFGRAFLDWDVTKSDEDVVDDHDDDSDSVSDVSHPSIDHDDEESDDGDDSSDNEDDVSVATSAVGKQALEMLLSRVAVGKQPTTKLKAIPQKRHVARKDSPPRRQRKKQKAVQGEGESFASASVGQGRAALDTLLARVYQTDDSSGRDQQAIIDPEKKIPSFDDASATTSLSYGRVALSRLLSQVHPNMSVPQPSNIENARWISSTAPIGTDNPDHENASAATSVSHGRVALTGLLSQVHANAAAPPPLFNSAQERPMNAQAPFATEDPDNEDASAATSVSHGRAALTGLLSQVHANAAAPPPLFNSAQESPMNAQAPFATEDPDNEDASAATSVIHGRVALTSLLLQVHPDNTAPPSLASNSEQTKSIFAEATIKNGEIDNEETSTATSVSHGRVALTRLLSQVHSSTTGPSHTSNREHATSTTTKRRMSATTSQRVNPIQKTSKKSRRSPAARSRAVSKPPLEEMASFSTSVKAKEIASDEFLSRKKVKNSQLPDQQVTEGDSETASVATSVGAGATALDALLSKVGKTIDER